jgi:ADP-heptose:LPS heptosyltransferase
VDFWIDLGRRLRLAGRRIAVTGGPNEADASFAREVARCLAAPVAAGGTCLPPLRWAAVARSVDAVVAPDTGIAHVAAAAGARVHVLFGPTDPARHAPQGELVDILAAPRDLACSPCYRGSCSENLRCQKALHPEALLHRVVDGPPA